MCSLKSAIPGAAGTLVLAALGGFGCSAEKSPALAASGNSGETGAAGSDSRADATVEGGDSTGGRTSSGTNVGGDSAANAAGGRGGGNPGNGASGSADMIDRGSPAGTSSGGAAGEDGSGGAAGEDGSGGVGGEDGSGGSAGTSAGGGGAGSGSTFGGYDWLSSSYIDGNSTHWEQGRDIAFDSQGNVIIVGGTSSSNYPATPNAFDPSYSGVDTSGVGSGGDTDVFVSKLNRSGELLWSTFLGSGNYDRAYAVELGPNDDVFIAGRAGSGFPTTPGVLQETFSGDSDTNALYGAQDGFVTRLSSTGDMIWSTYVGDSGQGIIRDIDVDDAGNVHFGFTGATGNLPTPAAWGSDTTRNGWDGFYGKLSADGSALLYGMWMGGSNGGTEDGREPSVRVAPSGAVYYLTWTAANDFGCITSGAFDTTHNGGIDLVLARFSATGVLEWCTYVGGSGDELVETHGLAVDDDDNAILASFTNSTDFPTTAGSFQPTSAGGAEAYVAKFDASGALVASTYLGGSGSDWVEGVAVAPNGEVVVGGGTESTDLPLTTLRCALRAEGAKR